MDEETEKARRNDLRRKLRCLLEKERAEIRAERDAKIIKLRQSGMSNMKIAYRMGISESTVRRAMK